MLQTITDIMDISELNAGTIKTRIADVHPAYVISNQVDKLLPSCNLKKDKLIVKIPANYENLIIQTDEELFVKILSQLLSNAVKFTANGNIIVGFDVDEKWVRFFVKDTGKGIAADKLNLIFEPFVQEDVTNTRGHEGNGLGLSLAKGMVELIGGKIWVESQKGLGSTFFFNIPYEKEKPGRKIDSDDVSAPQMLASQHLILIAEDDEMNFLYMKALLNRLHCSYIHALNGVEVVDLCRQHPEVGLVLMDIKMPVMNGIQATRLIREFRPELPIIASTAYAQIGDEQRFIEAGGNGYLVKPIKKDDLIKLLTKYLNKEL